ncbi:MAG: hypothetical protein AAB897_01805 [Patescibacteria group bacterium]
MKISVNTVARDARGELCIVQPGYDERRNVYEICLLFEQAMGVLSEMVEVVTVSFCFFDKYGQETTRPNAIFKVVLVDKEDRGKFEVDFVLDTANHTRSLITVNKVVAVDLLKDVVRDAILKYARELDGRASVLKLKAQDICRTASSS